MLNTLRKHFSKNELLLFSGTLISQAIPFLAYPVLTRLFSPSDFGVFSVFFSIVSIASVVVTCRYELAIMIPETSYEARKILFLSLLIAAAFCCLFQLLLFLFDDWFLLLFNNSITAFWLHLLPVTIFLTAAFQSLNYYVNHSLDYKTLTMGRVAKSLFTSAVSIAGGYFIGGPVGLIAGILVGAVAGILVYLSVTIKPLPGTSEANLSVLAKRYKGFPLLMLPAHAINTVSSNMPVILISRFFGVFFSGQFSFIHRIIASPMSILTTSLGDIFRADAAREYASKREAKDLYMKTFYKLFILGLVPFTVLFLFGERIFGFAFGDEWAVAGKFCSVMTPMFFLQFLANPLANIIVVAEKQGYDLIWQTVLLILLTAVFAVSLYFKDFTLTIYLYTFVFVVMYSASIWLSYRVACGRL